MVVSLILITNSLCPHVFVWIRRNGHVHVVSPCKQQEYAWGAVPPRTTWHICMHTNTPKMCVDQRILHHTPLCMHITVFFSTPPSTTTPPVKCGIAIAAALPCTMSTMCNTWCNIPAERGCNTGECVQTVNLLHGGVTKQLRPEHGADHNRCKHRALVRCSSDLLRDLSPFRICSSEVHKAERHAPIKMVEPALYAAMSRWEGTPEIDAVLGVCLAHLSRIFHIHGAQVHVHACGGALQNNFLRKLVHPGSSGEVILLHNTHALRQQTSAACGRCTATFLRGTAAAGALAAPNPWPPVCAFMLGMSAMSSPKSDPSLSTAAMWATPLLLAQTLVLFKSFLRASFCTKQSSSVLVRLIAKTLHST